MNRSSLFLVAALLVAALSVSGLAGDKSAWFDKDKCEFCKIWSENPEFQQGLVWKMTETADGVLSVMAVDGKHALAFHKANAANDELMQKLIYKEIKGEKPQLCGSCSTLVSFFPRGAKMHHMDAANSHIMLLTSGKATVVADMHKWAQRNQEEMAKLSMVQSTD